MKDNTWIEIHVEVPVDAQQATIAWFMDRGASGVQESWPGLFPFDGDGPVVSGDPREWHGDAAPNPSNTIELTAWLPGISTPSAETTALRTFMATLENEFPGAIHADIIATEIEATDWNAAWKATWHARQVGSRLIVHPSWEEPGDVGNLIPLCLDPGMAFGTGTHFTTASCLEIATDVLELVPDRTVTVLDIGSGSGILAIGALLLGARSAIGIDIDPDAVDESIRNADRNGVTDRFIATTRLLNGDEGSFDLVFANVVAQTLISLKDKISATVAPGGTLVLSGILHTHGDEVRQAFETQGLRLVAIAEDDTWYTIHMARSRS